MHPSQEHYNTNPAQITAQMVPSQNNISKLPFTACTGAHSVSQASAAIFLSNEINDFDSLIEAYQTSDMHINFPKIKHIYKHNSYLQSFEENNVPEGAEKCGFTVADIHTNNKISRTFQIVNEGEGRQYLSFHEFDYTRWKQFKELFLNTVSSLEPVLNQFTTTGLGLTYIDEYIWNKEEKIDYRLIFREDTKYLAPIFFEEGNTSSEMTCTLNTVKEGIKFIVRLDIEPIYSNESSILRVTHNAVYVAENLTMMNFIHENTNNLGYILQVTHDLNKDLMKSIMLDDVIKLINMT